MSLPAGANFAAGEEERIKKALEELGKDNHAPRELTIKVTLHVHHDYPKVLYKGAGTAKAKHVNSIDEETEATTDGYGAFQPEPIKEEV
jgi:hypothetical protein